MGQTPLIRENRPSVVIVNQKSGSVFSQKKLVKIINTGRTLTSQVEYVFPQTRQSTIDSAYAATLAGTQTLMVWGGDGSINAVLQGIMKADSEGAPPPVVIPLGGGSGSDFLRTLRLKRHFDHQMVDIGVIEILDQGLTRFFINGFSFGVTAEIAKLKSSMPRWFPGPLKYFSATLLRLMRGDIFSKALISDREHPSIISALTLNGQFVGGGMRILSDTRLDDGVFEQVLLPQMGVLSILNVLKSVYLSGLAHHPRVQVTTSCDVFEIKLPTSTCCESDGEIFQASHLRISIRKQAITIGRLPSI